MGALLNFNALLSGAFEDQAREVRESDVMSVGDALVFVLDGARHTDHRKGGIFAVDCYLHSDAM